MGFDSQSQLTHGPVPVRAYLLATIDNHAVTWPAVTDLVKGIAATSLIRRVRPIEREHRWLGDWIYPPRGTQLVATPPARGEEDRRLCRWCSGIAVEEFTPLLSVEIEV